MLRRFAADASPRFIERQVSPGLLPCWVSEAAVGARDMVKRAALVGPLGPVC